jgi:5'-phosphate synthase pdxT subunit
LRIGVLGIQGDVEEHVAAAKLALREEKLEGEVVWVKNAEQFDAVDGIIIPGGESTVIGWLVAFNRLLPRIRERVLGGMPALGTCAGLIALSKKAYDSVVGVTSQPLIGALDVTVERNTFGRQRESFEARLLPRWGRVSKSSAGWAIRSSV